MRPQLQLVDSHQDVGREVIALEADALRLLLDAVDGHFAAAVDAIIACPQRIVVSGIGKSGHVARKVAATLAATGTPALFVHAAEAAHGDVGMLTTGDILLVFSNSGETVELKPLCVHARRIGCRLIAVSRNRASFLMQMADVGLMLPDVPEACSASLAPTTSSTMMLALGDALAIAAFRARGLGDNQIHNLHPGGDMGRRLGRVDQAMHKGDRLPLVGLDTPMSAVLITMTEKRLGIAGVVDGDGCLVGTITDGDLRRHAAELLTGTAATVMTAAARTVRRSARVEDALALMQRHRITVLFVVDDNEPRRPVGVVQIYDITTVPQSGQ